MRVALLHNSSSGSEDHTDAELIRMIGRAGHEVVHVVGGVSALTEALQEAPCDLVVVAGGDGTVGRAACELSGWDVPIAILPLGTANNTANTLRLSPRLKKLVKSWSEADRRPFDVGLLDDGFARMPFSEAAGWGIFAGTIAEAKKRADRARPALQLRRDRKLFRTFVDKAKPCFYTVEVDGRDCSGNYLMVEVMNVPLLGPRLEVSPSSDPGDGALEVVLAGEEERATLVALGRTGTAPSALRSERGTVVSVRAADGVMHRDGKLLRHAPGERKFTFGIQPAAVSYLR